MIYEAFDVVVVPFPFSYRATTRRRPALVLSDRAAFNDGVDHAVLAMITSAANSDWLLDVEITNLKATGLPSASIVRMKLFTLDQQLIIRKVGSLASKDRRAIAGAVRKLFKGLV